MDNLIDFDIKKYEEMKEITLFRENQYVFKITGAELKENSWKPGTKSIKLELTCYEPEYHGCKIIDFFNIDHPDEEIRKKIRAKIRTISTCTNTEDELSEQKNISVFLGKEIGADIKISITEKGKYNKVYFYLRPEKVVKVNLESLKSSMESIAKDNHPNDDIPF